MTDLLNNRYKNYNYYKFYIFLWLKKGSRIDVGLVCEACHAVNYVVDKNKVNTTGNLKLSKFCNVCRKHTAHKETKIRLILYMKLVLIGIQGSGKSTQGNLLSKQLKIPYLSTGHIFRKIAKEKTQLGRYIKEILNAGLLVPDEKTIEIVNSYLSRPEYKKGYIL